ncbi:hypothetical protein WG922_21510 [Ramlibacter sp. AN1015]|uniref:hypothetical protein n=1 Tax=Ramlibacter sp. AN1015 TaxID=3133428 RepID=UPI0030BEA798
MTDLIERIRAKCVEEGDCWIWQGGAGGLQRDQPRMHFNKKKRQVRRVVFTELLGGKLGKGHGVSTKCGTLLCVCPEHMKKTTTSERSKKAGERGDYSTPLRRARVALGKRANSRLTPEAVREIRASDEAQPVIAARWGICRSTVSQIKLGKTWREYRAEPFAGLMR